MIQLPAKPRILVIRGGAIGDFILTLPAIGALRERWPRARIEILGYPRIAALADRRHYADAVRSIDAAAMASFFADGGDPDETLGEYFASFDLIVSYLYDPDEIFSTNLRRCRVRQLICGSAQPDREHAAIHFTRPLAALNIAVPDPQPRVFPSDEDRVSAGGLCPHPSPTAIHPGSGARQKLWPLERWVAIIRWLRDELARTVLLVGGEADEDARRALEPLGLPVAWNLPLPHLAAVLERCELFAGHDSGITHLAAAVGVPTLVLFGPTSPAIWAPRGPHVRVLAANGPMDGLAVEAVKDALQTMAPAHRI